MGAFDNLNNVKRCNSDEVLQWQKILNTDLRKVDKNGNKVFFYTYPDDLKWEFISQELDTNYKGFVIIKANDKTTKLRVNLENKQKKISQAVRKLFNK